MRGESWGKRCQQNGRTAKGASLGLVQKEQLNNNDHNNRDLLVLKISCYRMQSLLAANTVDDVIYSVLKMKKLNFRRIKSSLESKCQVVALCAWKQRRVSSGQKTHSYCGQGRRDCRWGSLSPYTAHRCQPLSPRMMLPADLILSPD